MARNTGVAVFVSSLVGVCIIVQFIPQLQLVADLGMMVIMVVIGEVIWSMFIFPLLFSPLRHIPGPKGGNFLFGLARQARLSMPRGEIPRKWMEEIPNDGLLRFRDLFSREALMPTSHAMLKAVLNDNSYDYEKQSRTVDALRPVLGDGLILVEGDVHKFQRKHLQPSFQGHVIRNLSPLFWNKACELVRMLEEYVNEPELELGVWCTRVTLDIIGIAGLGRDFNSLRNPNDEFVADYQNLLEHKKEKTLFFTLHLIFPYWLISKIPFWHMPRELKRISQSLYNFGKNLAQERRAELSNLKVNEQGNRKDILSLLVKSNDFTDHELAHQVLTMMAAGHETTSSTLSWCIYLLARHPEIQSKLRDEIRTDLPSPSFFIHASQSFESTTIDALPLLNAVCTETLRLYPVVPISSRVVIRPTTLGNYTLPAGTFVYIVPWAINRATRFWGDDATSFNPYRWLDVDSDSGAMKFNSTGGASGSYSFVTFLHGPRSCIGQGFARSELKHLLAALVGCFEFTLSRDANTYYPAGIVTTKPANGMWVKIRKVEGW